MEGAVPQVMSFMPLARQRILQMSLMEPPPTAMTQSHSKGKFMVT